MEQWGGKNSLARQQNARDLESLVVADRRRGNKTQCMASHVVITRVAGVVTKHIHGSRDRYILIHLRTRRQDTGQRLNKRNVADVAFEICFNECGRFFGATEPLSIRRY